MGLYFDKEPERLPFPGFGFGRALYRDSGRLDAMAREKSAHFYFMPLTWSGGTNARVEALRRGDFSGSEDGAKAARQ